MKPQFLASFVVGGQSDSWLQTKSGYLYVLINIYKENHVN